jgi:hypothetical protein
MGVTLVSTLKQDSVQMEVLPSGGVCEREVNRTHL